MDRLTVPLLRELIDRIEVFETEGKGKNRTQRIVIYYRFVGYVEIPEVSDRRHIKAENPPGCLPWSTLPSRKRHNRNEVSRMSKRSGLKACSVHKTVS